MPNPITPPIVFVIKSVISAERKPSISGWISSMPKLIIKQENIVFPKPTAGFLVKGNKKPNGIVNMIFSKTCLIKSPLPDKTSVKGTMFINLYG